MSEKDTLAALSEAATQGILVEDGIALTAGGVDVCLMGEPAQWSGDSPDLCPNDKANAKFLVALWNAYRSGQLVPVPTVESVAVSDDDAIRFLERATRNWRKVPPLSHDDIRDVADALTAVIAALKGESNV